MSQLYFFHGQESAPWGTKSLALKEVFPDIISPDFQKMEVPERLIKAEEVTRGQSNIFVVGSSLGGLLAALLYHHYPERFQGYLLLAPAIELPEGQLIDKAPEKSAMIYGQQDTIISSDAIHDYAKTYSMELVLVEDDHRLANTIEQIVAKTRALYLR